MGVTAANHAPFRRKESVLFGSEERTDCSCFEVPGGFLNVSLVDLDASEHDAVEPSRYAGSGFQRHPAIAEAIGNGMKFRASVNGVWQDFVPAPGGLLVDHERVQIRRWKVRDSGGNGTIHLFVYEFSEQATLRYEFLYFSEFLTAVSGSVRLGFDVTDGAGVRLASIRELVAYHYDNPLDMPGGGLTYADGTGLYAEGCVPFETAAMRADRIANRFNLEVSTQSAQMLSPLYAGVPHPTFGLWDVPPIDDSEFDQEARDFEAGRRASYAGGDSKPGGHPPGLPKNPLSHLGVITKLRPADAGDQAEFGAWTHVGNALGGGTPTGIDARSLWHQHTSAMRHINRWPWFTEADGEILDPATNFFMADGSNAKLFWEGIHWDPGNMGVNTFRRTHGGVGHGGDWQGHRQEHKGWNALACDFVLTGSFAARHMLMSMGVVMSCEFPEVETHESRAVGRTGIMAAMIYWATGNDVGLRYFANLILPYVHNRWSTQLHEASDPFRPYTSDNNPQGNSYAAGTWLWQAWQGGIFVTGLDAVLRMGTLAGVLTPTQITQIEELRLAEATALVDLAFAPPHTCGTENFGDAVAWTTRINMGTGARPVSTVLAPNDYCQAPLIGGQPDPNRKLDRAGTPGNSRFTSWFLMGIRIAGRIDPALTARATLIESLHRNFSGSVADLQHMGTA